MLKVLVDEVDWANTDCRLTDLCVTADGTIEDCASGMLHVDFANKSIGGGVLGEGCVQEEIRFAICPEMIVSRLFTEELAENECLFINGAERFSNYTGYGRTFRWDSNFKDPAPRDDWGRLRNEIVAIDAKVFGSLPPQLTERNLRRELNKAFCGFYRNDNDTRELSAVATGNWGCGAFGGDHRLKALLQLMAAAQARRSVYYFTFGDHALCRDIYQVHAAARSSGFTVGRLWDCIRAGGKSSLEIYRRIIAGQSLQLTDPEPNSPCYAADTP
jgi:poly(ADP-ribose) glycohydrolase